MVGIERLQPGQRLLPGLVAGEEPLQGDGIHAGVVGQRMRCRRSAGEGRRGEERPERGGADRLPLRRALRSGQELVP